MDIIPWRKRPPPPPQRPPDGSGDEKARALVTAHVTILRAKMEARRSILLSDAAATDSRIDAEALALRADEVSVILGLLGEAS